MENIDSNFYKKLQLESEYTHAKPSDIDAMYRGEAPKYDAINNISNPEANHIVEKPNYPMAEQIKNAQGNGNFIQDSLDRQV